jgi:cysteine desulfurase
MIRPWKGKVVYFDNNATTSMSAASKKGMIAWMDTASNPSSDSIISNRSSHLIEVFRGYILKHCSVKNYSVIFTSGASESNSFILQSLANCFKKPHYIVSGVEHSSILKCVACLRERKKIEYSVAMPNKHGEILTSAISKLIKPNTVLVSVMAANNEIGAINDIDSIGSLCKRKKIYFHTDAVQMFGKKRISMKNIDSLSMSFHKLHCPMGLGMIILNNAITKRCNLQGIISGSQQFNLRGGTENVPAIAGAYYGMMDHFKNIKCRNDKLLTLKKYFLSCLKKFKSCYVIGDPSKTLPNTVLFSIHKTPPICNITLKKQLEKKSIIVSIGSACATSSESVSHVLKAIKLPVHLHRGVIRVSFEYKNTKKEINYFISVLSKII